MCEANTNPEEEQYLDLVRRILNTGIVRNNRTGIPTRSLFGQVMRFDLRDRIPVLTTKRVAWKSVVEELLWMLMGKTDSKELAARGVKIWDANGTPEYLKSVGLEHREAGDLGPIYGFQWRHFGAKYVDCHTNYAGQGVDQLRNIVKALLTDPNDRRMVLSAWNPTALAEMALPPCHMMAQFICAKGELTCILNQRSGDVGLGVPFNITSYALLTNILARACGLQARELVHIIGDAHIYQNHEEALRQQLKNVPRAFPRLIMPRDCNGAVANLPVTSILNWIECLYDRVGEFQLEDYNPYPPIPMTMAI